jgi:hypothetical protein
MSNPVPCRNTEVAELLRKTPKNSVVRPIAQRILDGEELTRKDATILISFLKRASGWNTASMRLAVLCLCQAKPGTREAETAGWCFHNILSQRELEGDWVQRASGRTLIIGLATACTIAACTCIYVAIWFLQLDQLFGLLALLLFMVIAATIGTFFISLMMIPVTFPLSKYLDNNVRTEAARGLEKLGKPDDIACLLHVMRSMHSGLSGQARTSLAAILNRTDESNSDALSPNIASKLARVFGDQPLQANLDVIRVIGLIGQPSLIPWLRQIFQTERSNCYDAAQIAIAQIEDRARHVNEQATLLRPSAQVDESLLRPAASSLTPEEQLLRPSV